MKGFLDALVVVKEIIQGAKALAAFIQENKGEKWFREGADLFQDIRKAETREDRKKAAERLRDLIRGVG